MLIPSDSIRELANYKKNTKKGETLSCPGYERVCPSGGKCTSKSKGVYRWETKAGFGNAYEHLLKCHYGGDPNALASDFWNIHDRKVAKNIQTFYPLSGGYSVRESTIYRRSNSRSSEKRHFT
jgi:hypothetical protein